MEARTERRLVTSVFIDVVGSTELTRRLGPERVQRLLSNAFSHISEIADAEGGTVEKYIGDAIFVLFGATTARRDDAVRALRVASQAIDRVSAVDGQLSIRVGIETGDALVDIEGVAARQRMAVGVPVNIAARLQAHAAPGEVLVGPLCRAAVGPAAEFDAASVVDLKGIGPLDVARFVRLAPAASPSIAFVGRSAELDRLSRALERARAGRATLVVLSGESGIGKTRLASEFVEANAHGCKVLKARCRPGTEVGASPLRELLSTVESTAIPTAVAHSAGLLTDAQLLTLLAFDRSTQIFNGWRELIERLTEDAPLIVWIDDVHWAESELVRLFDRLTTGVQRRLFVLMTARPDFPAMTAIRPSEDHLVIELGPLDSEMAARLAREAGAADITQVARAEGHPLFILEIVRGSTSGGELPVNVQAAISARLDELGVAERELLQRAAIVSDTFDLRDAALLCERDPAEVAGMLARLEHLHFIFAVDGRYRFQHALVRDIAYGRLPIATRLRLHARYAQEGLDPANVDAAAHHWWEALGVSDAAWVWEGDPRLDEMRRQALAAHVAAGRGLGDRLALDRASVTFEHALTIAQGTLDAARVEEAFARALQRNARGDEATTHYLRAIELHRSATGSAPAHLYADALNLVVFNWGYFQKPPTVERVNALLDDGLSTARETGDALASVRLLCQRAIFSNDRDTLAQTEPLLPTIAAEGPFADALWRLGMAQLAVEGDRASALGAFDRAMALRSAGAEMNEPEALMWRSIALFAAGELTTYASDAARLNALSVNLSAHTRQHALSVQARLHFARGEWDQVEQLAAELRALVDANPDAGWCLLGANLVGFSAAVQVLRGRALPDDLEGYLARLLPEAPATRAASLLLPFALAGRQLPDADIRTTYSPNARLWDRQMIWDPTYSHVAVAALVSGRQADAKREIGQLERVAARGWTLAKALASAVREELERPGSGTHAELRQLGYAGLSDVLRFRASASV